MLAFVPEVSDAHDYPEEEVPDPPIICFGDPPSLSGFGVDYETGWNDTTFSFWLNFSSDEEPNNVTVQAYVDSIPYDMWENDTKDDDWTDGKDYFWNNDERLWSKGLIPYFFYTKTNGTDNTTDTNYFEILNRAPYMLEPPLMEIFVGEELEWEGRATDEDLDPLTWTIDSNITGDEVDEFEWETINYSFKLKIKCNHTFVRWVNLSVMDPYDNLAYWRWELYCVEQTTQNSSDIPMRYREEPDPTERGDIRLFGEGESDPLPTDTDPGPSLHSSTLTLTPTGDGHELDWTPKGAGNHFVEVDDAPGSPDDDTTYISVGSGNQEDYWSVTDHTTETAAIDSLEVFLRTKHSAGNEEFAICVYAGGTDYCTSDIADYAVWTTDSNVWATNPKTGIAWTWADIDALQIGVKSRAIGGWGGTAYCTQAWANVTYTAVANTNYFWCGSNCGGDEYQWDDENNWRESATWTVSGYPSDNDDTASFNETTDSLYLDHAANSVITIGALTTTSGFTGTITFSIDLVIDDAGTKNGSLNHKAAATIDVNTSNEQINMDGNLYVSSSATFTERAGILIVQGAGTQEIRVQDANVLYKLTTDTAGTVGELFDNLTAYQVTVGANTDYKCDAATRGYQLWHNWTDSAANGFVSTSSGTFRWLGGASNWCNMTTADAAPPPTTHWSGTVASGFDVIASWANFSYGTQIISRGTTDIENCTSYKSQFRGFRFDSGFAYTAFNNNTITDPGLNGIQFYGTVRWMNNIVITGAGSDDIVIPNVLLAEFQNSNFDMTSINHVSGRGAVTSSTHDDVANAYKISTGNSFDLLKSIVQDDFGTGDNIELVSGKFIMDEDGAAKTIQTESGTTLVIGKDVADASITLTLDDVGGAGFVVDETDGNLYINGTTTFPHTIRSANIPAVGNGWTGWSSNWPAAGSITEVHNTTMYNTRAWETGHEALAQYSNITFDMKGVNCACAAAFILYEPTATSYFNDISINGTVGISHATYIMPDSSHLFFKNLVITNHTSTGEEIEIDEGTTGEVVHFRNSNFDDTNIDFWGGGEECHWISQDHNDTAGRYLVGIHAGFNSSKSYVASGWDFGASDTVELIEGVLTIDENADATSFFIEESNAGIEVLSGYTLDLTTNLTNNGTLINNGTITDSGGYFNFYNTNPGGMWFNNSTVSNAKLAYYYGGFNFSLGISSNSTVNDWTLESPVDAQFNITYYDFNNKGSGVIWHLNATASSGSVYFGTNNLTGNERYDSYVDLVLYREHTADAGGWVNFSYNGWSTRHIYLTWITGVPPGPEPPGPGQYDRWIVGFEYSKNFFTNEVKFHAIFNYDHNASWYIWEFGDGSVYESAGPNLTRNFQFALYSTESVKLTIIATDGNRYWAESPIVLDNSLWIALICLAVISFAVIAVQYTKRERTKTELIMVEVEG